MSYGNHNMDEFDSDNGNDKNDILIGNSRISLRILLISCWDLILRGAVLEAVGLCQVQLGQFCQGVMPTDMHLLQPPQLRLASQSGRATLA
jgi:hypothetical protein